MSKKGAVAEKVLLPLVAAGTSAAAGVVLKKGPKLVEEAVLPRLRDWIREAGEAAEKLPEQAKSAVEGTGDLATHLTERAKGLGDGHDRTGVSSDEVRERSEERAKRRARRQKTTS